jgi:uridine kinase
MTVDRRATVMTIVERITAFSDRRVTVGVSGFGGSGKSTLARELVARIPQAARIRGDDFLDPVRSHQRSDDWDGMERVRLRREVLDPFRAGEPSHFRRYDWSAGRLGDPEPLPTAPVLIVDAIGLLHPELDGALDLTVWMDVDLATATSRGTRRDRAQGSDHEALWNDVWVPNELDFAARFDPRARADYLVEN